MWDPKDLLAYMVVPLASRTWLQDGARDYMGNQLYVRNTLLRHRRSR